MRKVNPWKWIPSLYFAEGLPYTAVTVISVILYKNMGLSNAEIGLYTSWFYLPWVIKPLWSPFVDLIRTKRWWIWVMQLFMGAGLACIALTIPTSLFLQCTIAFFWLLAFCSATHDIAADGFYMLALEEEQQAFFIGVRNTFYRVAMVTGQGLLVMVAGLISKKTGNIPLAWCLVFYCMAALFIGLSLWHFVRLPLATADQPRRERISFRSILSDFLKTFRQFFQKKGIIPALIFILTFRLGESQIVKMAPTFLLDSQPVGGLGLSVSQIGFIMGTVGVIAMLAGGITGGIVLSKKGLKQSLLPMTLAVAAPNLMYVLLSWVQPTDIVLINICIGMEQFGYGFGVTAFTMYLMLFSEGSFKTSHYAICTGFMALGMMLPGMVSGFIQEMLGYNLFFVWVVICSLPVFLVIPFLRFNRP